MSLKCNECKKEMVKTELTEEIFGKILLVVDINSFKPIKKLPENAKLKVFRKLIFDGYDLFLCKCGCFELKKKPIKSIKSKLMKQTAKIVKKDY